MASLSILGDSISAPGENWHNYALAGLGLTVANHAASGGAFWSASTITERNFSHQVDCLVANPTSAAVIGLGTNDWGNSALSGAGERDLGSYAVTVAKDFGQLDLNVSMEAMRHGLQRTRYHLPDIKLFGLTPLQRGDSYSPYDDMNVWVEAMRRMFRFYGVEVIDCFNEAGIVHGLETVSGSGQHLRDLLHPKETGMKLQARVIEPRIRAWMECL